MDGLQGRSMLFSTEGENMFAAIETKSGAEVVVGDSFEAASRELWAAGWRPALGPDLASALRLGAGLAWRRTLAGQAPQVAYVRPVA